MPTPIHCERLRATSSRSTRGQKNSRMVIRTAAALASATAQPKAPIPMLCDHRPQKAFCSRRRVRRRGRAALQGRVTGVRAWGFKPLWSRPRHKTIMPSEATMPTGRPTPGPALQRRVGPATKPRSIGTPETPRAATAAKGRPRRNPGYTRKAAVRGGKQLRDSQRPSVAPVENPPHPSYRGRHC
jgi:hypothetical protein